MIRERLVIFLINIFLPPLSVMIVAGPGPDCIINTLLFIAGVIPGHIHAFYVTCTYFNRKRKVRKGRYPGGRKAFIYSEEVWNGGARRSVVEGLMEEERFVKEERRTKRKGTGKGEV